MAPSACSSGELGRPPGGGGGGGAGGGGGTMASRSLGIGLESTWEREVLRSDLVS